MTSKIRAFILIIALSIGCADDSNVDPNTAEKDISEEKNKKEYILNSDCKAIFESIDFSSFCFSEDKTPKFEVGENYGISSRCQYRVSSDKDNFDFILLISASPDELNEEVITRIELNKRVLKSIGFNKITDLKDLGDDGYIAYDENDQTKIIHIRSNNLTIKVELSAIDEHNSCLFEDSDLERLVRVILESL